MMNCEFLYKNLIINNMDIISNNFRIPLEENVYSKEHSVITLSSINNIHNLSNRHMYEVEHHADILQDILILLQDRKNIIISFSMDIAMLDTYDEYRYLIAKNNNKDLPDSIVLMIKYNLLFIIFNISDIKNNEFMSLFNLDNNALKNFIFNNYEDDDSDDEDDIFDEFEKFF